MDSEMSKDIATPSSPTSSQNPLTSLSEDESIERSQASQTEKENQSGNIENVVLEQDNDDDENDDELYDNEEEMYQKISNTIKKTSLSQALIEKHHSLRKHNEEEVRKLITVVRNGDGDIIDDLHKTTPIMTKYERTRVLGKRCLQLENGDMPYVDLREYEDEILDDLFIAKLELSQMKLPFIIRRPLPDGSSEYWKINDLELI
jgi:DNA-directed RNA polymerase I, II, and III subunit RPABC2